MTPKMALLAVIGVLVLMQVSAALGLAPAGASEVISQEHHLQRSRAEEQFSCQECYECICNDHCSHHDHKRFIFDHDGNKLLHNLLCLIHGLKCGEDKQDGQWANWEQWTGCTGTTSATSRTRLRKCSNPSPRNCGLTCEGESSQTQNGCQLAQPLTSAPMTTKAPIPTTTTTTTTTRTATPSTTTPAATTQAPVFATCNKICTVSAVANKITVYQAHAQQCPGNSTGSSEALMLHCCGDLDHPITQRGTLVMPDCNAIPPYTAVAMFENGSVKPGTEAVFISCLSAPESGLKVIRQDCNTLPSVIHVNTTQTVYGSPWLYFTLQ